MLEREHPEDELVPKCQACSRYAGPPRPHEEPARESPRVTLVNGMRHGTAMCWREGCRCEDCVKAYRSAELKAKKRREAAREAAA